MKKKISPASIIFFVVIIVIIFAGFYFMKNILPNQLFNHGKKYLEIGQYEKALRIFTYVGNIDPDNQDAFYYQVVAISKMKPTYENQKKLYEITQLEDCDQASNLAETILANLRRQILKQSGSTYIDNVLFDDLLIRWNNAETISYSLNTDNNTPQEYVDAVKKAFTEWQTATNGELKFKDMIGRANINVYFVEEIPGVTDGNIGGKVVPTIEENKLEKMDVYLKSSDEKGRPLTKNQIYMLALHEIGHAIGLGSHSYAEDDVMYYDGDNISDKTEPKEITKRDIDTLTLLYKMIPDVIDRPIPEADYDKFLCHEILTTVPGENFEMEIKRLIAELRNDKQNVAKWVDLAINYALNKQYNRSNYILKRIFPLLSDSYENQFAVFYNLSVNYYRLRNYEEADKYLHMAENLKTDKDTEVMSAFIAVKQKRYDVAKKLLTDLQHKYPKDVEIALKLAEVYVLQKNQKEAKKVINQLVKNNPEATKDRRVKKYQKK